MKYAVKKSDGSYDTTLYNESNQSIIDFHTERGEELVPVQGLDIEWDEDGEPISVTPVEISIEQWRNSFKVELYKLKIALENKGDLEAIEAIIASQPKQVQIAWNNTPTVRRNSPTVASLAVVMEYTDEVLDQLFKDANEVTL